MTSIKKSNRILFTLIELLVTIAIIAMLASMLLPALSRVKGQARMIECMNNLKNISIPTMSYTNDNNGWIIPSTVNSVSWARFLFDQGYCDRNLCIYTDMLYLPKNFVCPTTLPTLTQDHINYSTVYGLRGDRRLSPFYLTEFFKASQLESIPPSRWNYIGDSINTTSMGPCYQFFNRMSSTRTIRMTHNHKGNMLCLDGHVAQIGTGNLEEYGILNYYP